MVKADPKKDYYADLDLTPGADVATIKKQYRRLALQYHPDRNPGRENECSSKFQSIQAAHEILIDPVLKAKYDSDRARIGLAAYRPAVPRNPYAATSDFPPPPSRTNPRPHHTSTASTGASRYSNVPRHGAGLRDDASTKANAFKAWEHLNKPSHAGNHGTSGPYGAPPNTPNVFDHGTGSAYSQQRQRDWSASTNGHPPGIHRSQSTRTPRKPYGAPTSDDDDRSGSSYFGATHANRQGAAPPPPPRNPRGRPPPPPPPPPPPLATRNRAVPDPLDRLRSNYGVPLESPRLRTPYSTKGGEKTYFSSSTLGRSSSQHPSQEGSPPERHRSASPPRTRSYGPAESPGPNGRTMSPPGSPPKRTKSDAGLSPEDLYRRQHHPRAQSHDSRSPSNPPGEDSTRSSDESPSFGDRHSRDAKERARRKAHSRIYPSYDQNGHFYNGTSAADGNQPAPPPRFRDTNFSPADGPPRSRSRARAEDTTSPTFTFEVNEDTFAPTPPPPAGTDVPSHDKVNTTFSPDDWKGDFTSNGHDYFKPPTPVRGADRGRQKGSPPRGRPVSRSNTNGLKSSPDRPAKVVDDAPPLRPEKTEATEKVTFSPDEWTQTFKPQTFAPPAPPSASPQRQHPLNHKRSEPRLKGSRGRVLSKSTAKRPPVPSVAPFNDNPSDLEADDIPTSTSNLGDSESLSRESSGESSAMEIDHPTPPRQEGEGTAKNPIQISESNGQPPIPPKSPLTEPPSSLMFEKVASSDGLARTNGPPRSRAASRPEAAQEDLKVDLASLKNVEPLAYPKTGLSDLNAISSTLPFESRPSTTHPSSTSTKDPLVTPQALVLPALPKPPPSPSKMSQSAWEQYLANAKAYMFEWAQFNNKMLAHFNERQREVEDGLTPNWMGIVGEGPKGGFRKYLQGVEEDFAVREHWDVAWERHREAMRKFGRVRQAAVEMKLRLG